MRYPALALLALAALSCGGDDSTGTTADTISFIVDGFQFSASTLSATQTGSTININGSETSGGVTHTLSISLQAASATTLSVGGPTSPTITYSQGSKSWTAANNSGSGSIHLSELSASKIAATFDANLPPVSASGATAAKAISNGILRLTIK